jgi:hypothetical protein
MAEERRINPDDHQAIELSESELQEFQRLEAKKNPPIIRFLIPKTIYLGRS